jgi:hypothetical protein
MAKRIGKYKVTKRDSAMSLADGGIVTNTLFARGHTSTTPSVLTKFPAPQASLGTGNITLTIAQILTGILEEDVAGAAAWTLPTAALTVAGVAGVQIGDTLDFVVINSDATNDIAITITAGTGHTVVGNMEVESPETTAGSISSGSAMFRIRFTGVASGSEACVCYRIA